MEIIYIIWFLFVCFVIFGWGIPSVLTTIFGAPWLPTPRKKVLAMLKLAKVHKGDTVYDLGSGYGNIVATASKIYQVKSLGVEIDPIKVVMSRIIARIRGVGKLVTIERGNMFDYYIGDASVVMCYLLQPANDKLIHKFNNELKKGTKIISHRFTFTGWKAVKKNDELGIYLYVIGKSN